jgi:SAP domain
MSYYEYSYRELQIELKKRELRATGKKDDLIARLQDSDDNGYVDQDAMIIEEELNQISKLFRVKTMMGAWYDVRLQNDQTIGDLFNVINEKTGIPIDQIRLATQDGTILDAECPVTAFNYSDVFLNMTILLRTRRR